MHPHFWHNSETPLVGLAPMDGVTDAPFRAICVRYGRPDVTYTEFTAVEGLRAGATALLSQLRTGTDEHPVVAQLFGTDPSAFSVAAALAAALGFAGVDVNMGCPAKTITQQGAGAALIADPARAAAIIRACREGIATWANGASLEEVGVPAAILAALPTYGLRSTTERRSVPVSVKTRLGLNKDSSSTWVPFLLDQSLDCLAVHGRTLAQQYSGEASWEAIGTIVQLVAARGANRPFLLGNGDCRSRRHAAELASTYGVDGVLIGRAALGNPWVFSAEPVQPSIREWIAVAEEHLQRALAEPFPPPVPALYKHLLPYLKGIPGASQYRQALVRTSSASEVITILAAARSVLTHPSEPELESGTMEP